MKTRFSFFFLALVLPVLAAVWIQPSRFAASSGPTLVASKNFNTVAAGYNPITDISGWSLVTGDISTNYNGGAGYAYGYAGGSAFSSAYYGTPSSSADQRCEVTLYTAGGGAFSGPSVRSQSGSDSCYYVYALPSGGLYVERRNSGTSSTVASDGVFTFSDGHKLAIEVTGSGASTRLKVQINTSGSWVDVTSGTLTTSMDPGGTYLGAGYAGIVGLLQNANVGVKYWAWYNL